MLFVTKTNILIRSLMLKKQKGDSGSKDGKANASNESSRKRLTLFLSQDFVSCFAVITIAVAFFSTSG